MWQGGWNIGNRWFDVGRWNELFPPWKKEHNSYSHWTPNNINWPATMTNSCWGRPVFKHFYQVYAMRLQWLHWRNYHQWHISPDIYIIILQWCECNSGAIDAYQPRRLKPFWVGSLLQLLNRILQPKLKIWLSAYLFEWRRYDTKLNDYWYYELYHICYKPPQHSPLHWTVLGIILRSVLLYNVHWNTKKICNQKESLLVTRPFYFFSQNNKTNN